MGLLITNKATAKQVAILHKLEYYGRGKYAAEMLSVAEAGEIIDYLFEEQRLADKEIIHYL
jgi:hypothetical protein